MASTQEVCKSVVEDVQDCLAVGVVDLNTGMLMGVHHTVAYFTQAYLDAVAAAAVDMFRGKNVRRIEELLSKQRGTEVRDTFEELFISSTHVFHFMRLLREKQAVVVMVTRKTTNQGMGWASLRAALGDIQASLP
jgi:Mg2+ and Co2+ transporter CorA